jgi:16S rRNA (guanine527-N7)-methyltransferase
MHPHMTAQGFAEQCTVSRETLARLQAYVDLLCDWQTRMNLVGPATLPDVWQRHILDSAQLYGLAGTAEQQGVWLDIGSGAGFPALILAALGLKKIHLIESITKKCRFLEAASRVLAVSAQVHIHNQRAEAVRVGLVDVITARACASLDTLFALGLRFAKPNTLWLLPKGQDIEKEIQAAHKMWDFTATLMPSISDSRGRIVVARQVKKRI